MLAELAVAASVRSAYARPALRIVHAADLHIDSPLRGLSRYEGAPVARARSATREAFTRVIDTCLEHDARFLVLAGDVFDGDWKDAHTGLFFLAQLARLTPIGCRVLLLRGNHDFELTRALAWPSHVHEFSAPDGKGRGMHRSFVFPDENVVFHGVSYPTREVKESLLPHYPPKVAGMLNVGVLHTSATGARGASEHLTYAPCSPADLVGHGYEYWALGHVHTHQVLSREPWVVYPGNTQGRSVRETGPKGCVVIDVEGTSIARVEHVETDVMRWYDERLVLTADDGLDDLFARVRERLESIDASSGDRLCAVRLTLEGACSAHEAVIEAPERIVDQLRAEARQVSERVWLEKVELATSPVVPLETLRRAPGLIGDLLRHVEVLRTEEAESDLLTLGRALDPLAKKAKRELEELRIDLGDRDVLLRALADAEAILAHRLTAGEPSEG